MRRSELLVLYRWMHKARTSAIAENSPEDVLACDCQIVDSFAIAGREVSRALATTSGYTGERIESVPAQQPRRLRVLTLQ